MVWFAVILSIQCLTFGLMGWILCRRNESAILRVLKVERSAQDNGVNSSQVCNLLATAGKALSAHSEDLGSFERSLRTADDGRLDSRSLGRIRQANQTVEQAVESTMAGLIAACGELLKEERSGLEAYRKKTSAFEATLASDHEQLLVQVADTLLGMVCELREENKAVREEVAAGKQRIIELLTRASSAEQIARMDALTQLPNRRAFDEAYLQCEESQARIGHPFSLLLLDIDHFKSVNDKYGHAAGDAVLLVVARTLRENCKTSDHVCRVGGEEFAVLLPRCEERSAKQVAECFRRKIESTSLHHNDHEISITVSCGVAQAISGKSQANTMERADAALYSAKTSGRNQTCVHGDVAEIERDLQLSN